MKGVAFYAMDPWALGAGRVGVLVGRILFPSFAPFPFAILPSIGGAMGCLVYNLGGHGERRLKWDLERLGVPCGRWCSYEGSTVEFAWLLTLSLCLGSLVRGVPSHGYTEGRNLGGRVGVVAS